jgi:hypothetical protein
MTMKLSKRGEHTLRAGRSLPNRAAFQTGVAGALKKLKKNACIVFPTEIVGDPNHITPVDINDRMKDETRKP